MKKSGQVKKLYCAVGMPSVSLIIEYMSVMDVKNLNSTINRPKKKNFFDTVCQPTKYILLYIYIATIVTSFTINNIRYIELFFAKTLFLFYFLVLILVLYLHLIYLLYTFELFTNLT